MRIIFRLIAWLVMLTATLSISGCAELALPPEQLRPVPASDPVTPTPPDNQIEVIVNIAPTPTPAPQPTVTPQSIAIPLPIENARPLSTNSCTSKGKLVKSTWSSEVFGRKQNYLIYLPPCYDAADNQTRYPVIYLFHGWPMNETHWVELGVVAAADQLIDSGELPPFIIALPRGDTEGIYNHTSGGDKSWEGAMVNEFIPYVDQKYRTLAQQDYRAIGGISRGGVWALEIAFRHPELFSAVGAHSSALSVNDAASDFDPLDLVSSAPIDSMRIYLDSGNTDWTRDTTAKMSKLLEARHIPHTFTIGQGDHTNLYWASQVQAYLKFYAAPWVAEKLAAQKLAAPTP